MNLLAALLTKSAASPYAGTASGIFPGASAHTDVFRSEPAPSPIALIQENLGTAYACASFNTDLIASTRLRLYVKTRKGEGRSRLSKYNRTKALSDASFYHLVKSAGSHIADATDVEEVTTHPMIDLMRRPNGVQNNGVGMSLFTLLESTQLYQEIVGRSYWYLEQNGPNGTPSQIWVLAPQYVTEWPGTGENAPIIAYYEFALGTGNLKYPTETVVPFRLMDPSTGGYTGGLSPLRACFEAHKLARSADAMVAARVRNGGKPDAVFSPDLGSDMAFMGKDEAARLEGMLRSRYRMAGAGSIVVTDIPGKLQPISWPINDVIDLARYQLTRAQIAEAFKVPMTKLHRDTSTYASARSGDFAHANDAGLPRCRRNEAALNTFFIPMYGDEAAERLFFAYDDPPGLEDPDREMQLIKLAHDRGQVQGNEYRAMIHLRPVPQGDSYLAPNTLTPLLSDGKPDPAYYRGANTQLASAEGDTGKGATAPPVDVPAQNAQPEQKPRKKKPSADAKLAKAMLKALKLIAGKQEQAASAPVPIVHVHAAQPAVPPAPQNVIQKMDGPRHDVNATLAKAGYTEAERKALLAKPAHTEPHADL